jgi:nicotinamide-nucleotide amidase
VYSNEAKTELLGVPADLIAARGAVSKEVARAMADGARKHSVADVSISCTGIAGPGGGTPEKPVGLVHLAVAADNQSTQHRECMFGELTRDHIRIKTVDTALQMLLVAIRSSP